MGSQERGNPATLRLEVDTQVVASVVSSRACGGCLTILSDKGVPRNPSRKATGRRVCPRAPLCALSSPSPREFSLCPSSFQRTALSDSEDCSTVPPDPSWSKVVAFFGGACVCCWTWCQENKDGSVWGCGRPGTLLSPSPSCSLIALSDHPANASPRFDVGFL